MQHVIPIPAFHDNYIWLIMHPQQPTCVVVDPGDSLPVLDFIQKHQLTLQAILVTHHHADHTGGVAALLKKHPVPVFGPAKESMPGISDAVSFHALSGGAVADLVAFNQRFQILDIPGHTAGHIAYYGDGMLFCGDTLFAGGCGRLFEGTAEQMLTSLSTLAALPDETQVYCAHEYTSDNLEFARAVEPENIDLQQRIAQTQQQRSRQQPTLPSTMVMERATNPFLRTHIDSVKKSVERKVGKVLTHPVDVFAALRTWKDHWKGEK